MPDPHLGVVRTGQEQSFVIADIPGLIKGAAQGAGLGIQFLKHLSRTRLLLHLVDIAACKDATEIVEHINIIKQEITQFGADLEKRERWLVLNKSDLLPAGKAGDLVQDISSMLDEKIPVFLVSAITGAGCESLVKQIQEWLDNQKQRAAERKQELVHG